MIKVAASKMKAYLRVLVIDAPQGTGVKEQLVECTSVHAVRVGGDRGLLSEYDLPGDGRVDRKHSPVHEAPIPEVWIVDFFSCPLQDFMDERFRSV